MKYIIIETQKGMIPFIFPNCLLHSEIACQMKNYLERAYSNVIDIKSAGFWDVNLRQCYGESMSLNLKSSPEDTVIISNLNSWLDFLEYIT